MNRVLTIPPLGETTEEVLIVGWLVEVGAVVAVGDRLVEVETDKVEMEIESPVAGVVTRLLVDEGAEVPVGDPYCEIEI